MQETERNKLIELTSRAVSVNEELLADEKKFIATISTSSDVSTLHAMNEHLNELCSKEHLLLSASRSLLQIMLKKA
jgi:hypothetical protein